MRFPYSITSIKKRPSMINTHFQHTFVKKKSNVKSKRKQNLSSLSIRYGRQSRHPVDTYRKREIISYLYAFLGKGKLKKKGGQLT